MLYLIDFGLACAYLENDGSHTVKTQLNKFSGNFLFASLNSCRGFNKSRRDDIEAIFYVLIYLLNNKTLPWTNFDKNFQGQGRNFRDYLAERLKKTYTRQLFKMIPNEMRDCLKKVFMMRFDEEPPYDEILKCLQTCFEESLRTDSPSAAVKNITNGVESAGLHVVVDPIESYVFEWNLTLAKRIRNALFKEGNQFNYDK